MKHAEQQRIWNAEHASPTVLKQMDSREASSGVERFATFLREHGARMERGVEMGCGKGRNVNWLAVHGVRDMYGFDFSPAAIAEATRRAQESGAAEHAHFLVQDATARWPWSDGELDFAIDCFASTDIESPEGRSAAIAEMFRVLKPGGYVLAYLLSTEDEFHKEMMGKQPAEERNSFVHSTGKFEKTFDERDIAELYGQFETVTQQRVEKTTEFFGKPYRCYHHWLVLRKPTR